MIYQCIVHVFTKLSIFISMQHMPIQLFPLNPVVGNVQFVFFNSNFHLAGLSQTSSSSLLMELCNNQSASVCSSSNTDSLLTPYGDSVVTLNQAGALGNSLQESSMEDSLISPLGVGGVEGSLDGSLMDALGGPASSDSVMICGSNTTLTNTCIGEK